MNLKIKVKKCYIKVVKNVLQKNFQIFIPAFLKIAGGGGNELSAQRNGFPYSPIHNISDLHFLGGVIGNTVLVIKHLRLNLKI